jgi:hypothetical protein
MSSRLARIFMIAMGALAFAWSVFRACVQSVVGDEAITYIWWVRPVIPEHWQASPNNHILNSLLMRASIAAFGLSHVTLRAPALLSAAVFIGVAFWFSRRISDDWKIQVPLFLCLVYNPFVFDFFVAARGYGLATALLMCALAVSARWHLDRSGSPVRAAAISSLLIGLSFTANFSFAFADAFCLLLLLIWGLRAGAPRWKLLAAYSLPAMIVILAIPSSSLLEWQSGMLFYGAHSMREMTRSIMISVFQQLNPFLVNPLLLGEGWRVRRLWLPSIGVLVLIQAIYLFAARRKLTEDRSRWLVAIAGIAVGTAGGSLLVHWLSFRWFGLLLPLYRTALYLAPLATLLIGALASLAVSWRRRALTGLLFVLAAWFLLSLRLSSFIEWEYDSEAKDAYYTAANYAREHCIQDVAATWRYDAALDFYRLYTGNTGVSKFTGNGKAEAGHDLYVLHGPDDIGFIQAQKLNIVYNGPTTDIVIAVRPSAVCEISGR